MRALPSTVALVALGSFLLAGCGSGSPATHDASQETSDQQVGMARPDPALLSTGAPLPPSAPPTTAISSFRLFSPSNPAYGPQPPEFDAPCEAGKTTLAGFGDVCGTKGRVSVEFQGGRTISSTGLPCQLVTFVRPPPSKNAPPPSDGMPKAACVAGDELLATATCEMCRIPGQGWSLHGHISEMTADQGTAVMSRLEIAAAAPTTAKGWATLINESKARVASN